MANLYLIQSTYSATASVVNKLQSVYQAQDSVVFMGESVNFLTQAFLESIENLYILESELPLLSFDRSLVKILSYDAFADLCLAHTRCISFR